MRSQQKSNTVRKRGHLSKKTLNTSKFGGKGARKKGLTEEDVLDMKMLNTFVNNTDDFFSYDPSNLQNNSDVDEERPKKSKNTEDDFMGERSKKLDSNKEDEYYLCNKVIKNLQNSIKSSKSEFSAKESTKYRTGLLYALEEFYKPEKQESDNDMEVDQDETKTAIKVDDSQDDSSKKDINTETLKVRALFSSRIVKSHVMQCEILGGLGTFGEKLKGTKIIVLFPIDFDKSIYKTDAKYHLIDPVPLSEKLAQSQLKNLFCCRKIILGEIKQEVEDKDN
ncbi:unnamed protein product [Moneuplotes crassus]|uniref:Uncharacterized protein n=1 Tax=Euplotes crassus TaxID=5936 RepID=A0AAD2CXP0_EUPCR|nr:unnamed protein product [Moneuplotes crassus]